MSLSNALIRRPTFILIDEPESHLHPSLQVDFLTTLASYATQGLAFATHSIGLARTVSDRIYAIVRTADSSRCLPLEGHPHLSELLGNLSYSGHFPLEFTAVLLVEGSTEVRAMQVLLRKLRKDHSYVVLPLGGSQLIKENADIELAEVVRIAGSAARVFAVIDSERIYDNAPLDSARMAFLLSCERLGITCHVTSRRATENYFRDSTVKEVFGSGVAALSPYGVLADARPGWPKSENWRLAMAESDDFFEENDLGKFLKHLPDGRNLAHTEDGAANSGNRVDRVDGPPEA